MSPSQGLKHRLRLLSQLGERGGEGALKVKIEYFKKKIEIYIITKYFINSMIVFWTEKQKLL